MNHLLQHIKLTSDRIVPIRARITLGQCPSRRPIFIIPQYLPHRDGANLRGSAIAKHQPESLLFGSNASQVLLRDSWNDEDGNASRHCVDHSPGAMRDH